MQNNSRKLQKTPVLVELQIVDGSKIQGKLFTTPQERLIDVLNDNRTFLPIETMDGTVLALAKTAIQQVVLPEAIPAAYKGSDPYMILGVPKGVSKEKLKEAYHKLCLNCHPDRVRSFGLGTDFQELGSQNMVRINNAYTQILRTIKKGGIDAFEMVGNSDA